MKTVTLSYNERGTCVCIVADDQSAPVPINGLTFVRITTTIMEFGMRTKLELELQRDWPLDETLFLFPEAKLDKYVDTICDDEPVRLVTQCNGVSVTTEAVLKLERGRVRGRGLIPGSASRMDSLSALAEMKAIRFGLTDYGALLDLANLRVFDSASGDWVSPPHGMYIREFMEAKPLSTETGRHISITRDCKTLNELETMFSRC